MFNCFFGRNIKRFYIIAVVVVGEVFFGDDDDTSENWMCKRWESWDIVFHLLAALQTALFRLDWIECVSSSRHFAFTFYRHVFPSIFMQCSPVRLFILRLLRSTMKCTPKSAKFFHVWHQMGDFQLLLHCWWENKSRHSTFLTARCRDKRMKACSGSALTLSCWLVFWCHNGDAMHGNVAAHHPAVVKRMRNHNKIIQMFFSFFADIIPRLLPAQRVLMFVFLHVFPACEPLAAPLWIQERSEFDWIILLRLTLKWKLGNFPPADSSRKLFFSSKQPLYRDEDEATQFAESRIIWISS